MLPDGKNGLHSTIGCSFTFLLVFSTIFYGSMQAIKAAGHNGTQISYNFLDNYFGSEYETDNNLMYAFGITAYDSNPEPIEDPSIGTIKPYYKSWKNEVRDILWTPIPARDCTRAELHIDDESDADSYFFKPNLSSKADLSF